MPVTIAGVSPGGSLKLPVASRLLGSYRMPSARALAGVIAFLVIPWAIGCGTSTRSSTDGPDASTPPDAPGGRRSFDVLAVLTPSDMNAGSLPPSNAFTLVLDVDARQAIAGGNGRGTVVGLDGSGTAFRTTASFTVGGQGDLCSGLTELRYDEIDVTEVGAGLVGTAMGAATISCGDCSFMVPFSATLSGTPDATPPTLLGSGASPATPFDAVSLFSSEPLPATATARLVSDDGAGVDLVPTVVTGDVPLVVGFSKPDIVLGAGHGYTVALDGLVDFAGLTDTSGTPLRLGSFADAPTVPEDGFESATGSVLGGAMVMTGGPLPAISGATSLYIGTKGAPALDTASARTLMVRLARQPGDTVLRFSFRVVGTSVQTSFAGTLRVGSEGASAAPAVYSFVAGSDPPATLTVAGQTVFASAVATEAATLPADATDEVLVVVAPSVFTCSPLANVGVGLLIDDLRLE